MNENTINNDVTIAGRASVLASRYRIVRQLGSGGMGSVWLAEDMQLDGKLFAIKMLPSILVANKRAYQQLKSEALVSMRLTHPNIVTLRAFEENNGNPFLVMDYIDGETLDDWLGVRGQESGVSEEEVVKLLKPIAEALDYAHEEGVVHRDIKPANVMIRKDGRPFVMDFGIAREIQETLTRVTGKMSSGTLMYMSPEQLNGDMPKKEQDIYSFAAMVYECLKGEPPFCRGAIEDQIKNKEPEPLVGRVVPNAPNGGGLGTDRPTIADAVMRGLAKKPEDRPTSCVEVLEKKFNRVERVGRVEPGWQLSGGGAFPRNVNSKNGNRISLTRNVKSGKHVAAVKKGVAVPARRNESLHPPMTGVSCTRNTGPDASRVSSTSRKNWLSRKGIVMLLAGATVLISCVGAAWWLCSPDELEVEARRLRSQLSDQYMKMQRLSDDNGFAQSKKEIYAVVLQTDENISRKRWSSVICNCETAQKMIDRLFVEDVDRCVARTASNAAQTARESAEKTFAEKYAPYELQKGVLMFKSGERELAQREFKKATIIFKKVEQHFQEVRKLAIKRNLETVRKEEDAWHRSEVESVRAKASVEISALNRIDDADGFGESKREAADKFKEAEDAFEAGRWQEAKSGYENVVDLAAKVISSDVERKRAAGAKNKALKASIAAAKAGARRYAAWNEAMQWWMEGDTAFKSMRFSVAEEKFSESERRFHAAEKNAKSNALSEKSSQPSREQLFKRPVSMNYCRHCGYSLVNADAVPRNCQQCGGNLFGE
ncbi:MAG: protein kinase [Kiritimatiellae bacterium]|nr:protein kinase [Kiritimatiellia bacterium]